MPKAKASKSECEATANIGAVGANKNKTTLGGVQAWTNWALGTAFVVVVFIMQSGYAITNSAMALDLKLTLTQVGLVGSVYTWVFAVAQFASGSMLDKLGTRKCLPIAVAVLASGVYVYANAHMFELLVLGQILMALGASFGFIGAGFIGGQWFSPIKYGFMFSLVQLCASLGAQLGQTATISALQQGTHWSSLISFIAFAAIGVCVLMLLFLREPKEVVASREGWKGMRHFVDGLASAINTVAAIRANWLNVLVGGATFGSMFAVGVVWGPRLLVSYGIEGHTAGSITSLTWLGLALGAPAFSFIADKLGRLVQVMRMAVLLQAIAILAVLVLPVMDVNLYRVLYFLFGFAAGGSMLPYAIAAKLVPAALIGTSAALVNAVQFITSGIIMAIPGNILAGKSNINEGGVGLVSNTSTDYALALAIIPIVLLAAFALSYLMHEPNSDKDAAQRKSDFDNLGVPAE